MQVFGHHLGASSDQITQTLQGGGVESGQFKFRRKISKNNIMTQRLNKRAAGEMRQGIL